MEEKEELIEEIKRLIAVNEDDKVEINPNFLDYFDVEELESIKNKLKVKKSNISQSSLGYLDKLYEKTKKDEI
ncbi:hypothetical protein CP960_07245 [Malaciobacter halophilus]|uniref:Uncharacterized protein n=1 Tax=Malaciobacter halophilus TaxID=197482 RepID=A0A2N1J2L9_9BACT|nr:hypothetical protein [Malaciobacter halophilus]AXH09886.1 hypothetical protein AHALO_1517 [Malaciobacter halophilus]PKI80791.1 hypothetical protein CP960_07245 [Malaciobacter halophilus]